MFWFMVWVTSAFAAEGLVWTWNDSQPVQYEVATTVTSPSPQRWMGFKVGEARIFEHMMLLSTTCTGSSDGKRWRVECSIDSLEIHAKAVPGDTDKWQPIVEEYLAFFTGKTVRFSAVEDGRIKNIDFMDVETRDGRAGIVIEGFLKNISRAFAPFDFQMPKDGLDKGKDWRQKGTPLALSAFGSQGTAGSLMLKRRVVGSGDASVSLTMDGRGSIALGASPEVGSAPMVHLNCRGKSQFNTKLGVLDWAEVNRKSAQSSSNIGMGVGGVPPATFRTQITRVGSRIPLSGPEF